jgi:hypothetical protein
MVLALLSVWAATFSPGDKHRISDTNSLGYILFQVGRVEYGSTILFQFCENKKSSSGAEEDFL